MSLRLPVDKDAEVVWLKNFTCLYICYSKTRAQDQSRPLFQVCLCNHFFFTLSVWNGRPSPPQQAKHPSIPLPHLNNSPMIHLILSGRTSPEFYTTQILFSPAHSHENWMWLKHSICLKCFWCLATTWMNIPYLQSSGRLKVLKEPSIIQECSMLTGFLPNSLVIRVFALPLIQK